MDPQELKNLRNWFTKNAAELPWRLSDLNAKRDPYAVWISETMLQQTQVATVKDYYIRWMKRFPDIASLAAATEEEVFRYWQGLGYYSRARNILKTAQIVAKLAATATDTRSHGTPQMPTTRKELEALPGIGAYTAGAILSLAYHKPEAILDGNLVRIFSRFYTLDFLPTDKIPDKQGKRNPSEIYWDYARKIADSPKAYLNNEALMELGRTICKIKNPCCENCPLRKGCKSFAENRVQEFPPAKKHIQKNWHGTVLVVESADHKILAVKGGQKFFNNQIGLPHFESQKGTAAGLPFQAEDYINADTVAEVAHCGSFRHSITVHKMECEVLHIQLNATADKADAPRLQSEFLWIEKAKAAETFANSFSLKAISLAYNKG